METLSTRGVCLRGGSHFLSATRYFFLFFFFFFLFRMKPSRGCEGYSRCPAGTVCSSASADQVGRAAPGWPYTWPTTLCSRSARNSYIFQENNLRKLKCGCTLVSGAPSFRFQYGAAEPSMIAEGTHWKRVCVVSLPRALRTGVGGGRDLPPPSATVS